MTRIALPTGDLRAETAALLESARCGIPDYAAGSRALRFSLLEGAATARVFRERDIPAQVALGNYDIGICGSQWVEELARRFPGMQVIRLRDLPFGVTALWLAAGHDGVTSPVRLVTEFPNIAEHLARKMRLARYRIFGVLGAADAYPPEDADLALLAGDEASVSRAGLRAIAPVLRVTACLIANSRSLASRELAPLLSRLCSAGTSPSVSVIDGPDDMKLVCNQAKPAREKLRLALPDGHAQSHTQAALIAAGIAVDGYGGTPDSRRPTADLERVEVKVIRPQDMPQQVAIGHFDLAITGRDVLFDHLVQFPSSPVEEVLDLWRSRYSLAAIVKDVQAETVAGALEEWRLARPGRPIRIASEYPNIADQFARERHFGRYSVIPIAGASEGFVPDDAEILIEGIETGSSVRANNLTVLERFFESTNIVIANKRRPQGSLRSVYDALVERLRAGALQPAGVLG